MPNWLRAILAIVAGFVAWWVAATIGNFAVRLLYPGYAEVEKALTFTLGMMLARLTLGAVASIVAGVVCAAIARGTRWPRYALALLLLALFIPVHVFLREKFPFWYHIVFLGSLVPLVLLGARLMSPRATV